MISKRYLFTEFEFVAIALDITAEKASATAFWFLIESPNKKTWTQFVLIVSFFSTTISEL
jgi:hypothetical protein